MKEGSSAVLFLLSRLLRGLPHFLSFFFFLPDSLSLILSFSPSFHLSHSSSLPHSLSLFIFNPSLLIFPSLAPFLFLLTLYLLLFVSLSRSLSLSCYLFLFISLSLILEACASLHIHMGISMY